MELCIVAPGSRGDIQPYLALAVGLRAAGHGVRLVTTLDHAELCREHGVEPWLAAIDVRHELEDPAARAAIEGGGLVSSFRRFAQIAERGAALLAEQALAASDGADAVLVGFGGLFLGAAVAERRGIPLVQAYNVPFTPTADMPGVLVPWLSFPPRGATHRLGARLSRQAIWLTARTSGNAARRSVLGLPSAPVLGPYGRGVVGAGPVLYGLSPAALGRPADWDPAIRMDGFWFLDALDGWAPPEALSAFLAAGPAPVYIGFGSMGSEDPAATARLVLEAVAQAGCRAVIHAGWGGLAAAELPAGVHAVGAVPHAWLFPRTAAVVHHGGAGTTAAGLRAGVPGVVVPFHGDQPFWGRMVHRLGVGPAPIARRRLTAPALAATLRTALDDTAMRDRAAALGARIREEDGVGGTVRALEELLGSA